MTENEALARAIALAVQAHGATVMNDGKPYILHPLRLMGWAEGYDAQIAAVLHDTIEDTNVTLQNLRDEGFSPEIVAAVDALSRRDGETYEEFIERIALDPLATRVKLLDLTDNMDATRLPQVGEKELERMARYHRAWRRLRAVQP